MDSKELNEVTSSSPSYNYTAPEVVHLNNRFEEHLREYEARQQQQERLYEHNMAAISEVTKAIDSLTKATAGLVEAWSVANNLQKFFKWLSGFAVCGAIIAYLVKHSTKLFG